MSLAILYIKFVLNLYFILKVLQYKAILYF